jgi:hypothetical protein
MSRATILALVALGCALFPSPSLSGSTRPPAGISYDEIRREFFGVRPEEPGHFDEDRNAILAAKGPRAGKLGHLYHISFLADSWRLDDLLAMHATIVKPTEVIQIDLRHKRYEVLTGNAAVAAVIALDGAPSALESGAAPAQSATALDLNERFRSLPALRLGNVLAPGIEISQTIQPVAHAATCVKFERVVIDILKFYDPRYAASLSDLARDSDAAHIASSAPGCPITYNWHGTKEGTEPGADRFALYRVDATVITTLTPGKTSRKARVAATLVERANIRELGPRDAPLFAPPANFKQAATPTPEATDEPSVEPPSIAPAASAPASKAPASPDPAMEPPPTPNPNPTSPY